jgi:hypothetical protein
MRGYLVLLTAVLVAPPLVASATEWQHEGSVPNASCDLCHSLYAGAGTTYDSGCLGCHSVPGKHSWPWTPADQAVPGVSGNNHNWSGVATSATAGATTTQLPDSARNMLVAGKLQCTVCHNPHASEVAVTSASMDTSIKAGEPMTTSGTTGPAPGTASLMMTVNPGTPSFGVRVMVASVDAGGGTFILSHFPGGPAGSWLNWNGTGWAYNLPGSPGRPFQVGTDVAIDVGGVRVRWTAGAAVGDYWDLYAGYPFLRLSNIDDYACYNCHKERSMNHVRARGMDPSYLPNGTRRFSHPVGVGLNANNLNRDRGIILDADGTVGSSAADGLDASLNTVRNDSNNLDIGANQLVRCTTCHAVHATDSNSLTVDVR